MQLLDGNGNTDINLTYICTLYKGCIFFCENINQSLVETYVCKHLDALDYVKCRDENGMINAEKLILQMIVSAKKFGPAVEHFPIVGNITFTERDLISLARYLGLPDY